MLCQRKSYCLEHAHRHIICEKDNLTAYETIMKFAKDISASLKIMEDGEHWFHTVEQLAFLDDCLRNKIQ